MPSILIEDLQKLQACTGFFGRYRITGMQYRSPRGKHWHMTVVPHPSLHVHNYWVSGGRFGSAHVQLGSTTQIMTDMTEELDCKECRDVASILNQASPTVGSQERFSILEAIRQWERNIESEAARQG